MTLEPGQLFSLARLLAEQRTGGRSYHEFLVRPALSAGIYHLAAGEADRQNPHTEDEVYYVLNGSGEITIDGTVQPVAPGDFIYVAAGVEHRFHDYPEGITLLVVFAPARGSAGG